MYFTCLVSGRKSYYYHAESYRDRSGSPRRISVYVGSYPKAEKYILNMDVGEEKEKLLLQRLKEMEKNAIEKIKVLPPKKKRAMDNNTDSQNSKDSC